MKKKLLLALMLIAIFTGCDKSKDDSKTTKPEAKITITGVADMTVSRNSVVTTALAIASTSSTAEKTDLSATGLPAGVTATFDPASGTNFSSVLTIAANASAAAGTYPIKIVGKTATGSKSYDANLIVSASNIIMNGVTDLTVFKGENVTAVLGISTTGIQEKTDLSVTGLPNGVSASFSPSSGTPNFGSTLTISASGNAASGVYPIKIVAKTATDSRSYDANLTVKDPCDIFLGKYTATYEWSGPALTPNTIEIKADQSTAGNMNLIDLFQGGTFSFGSICQAKTISISTITKINSGPLANWHIMYGQGNFSTSDPVLNFQMSAPAGGYVSLKVTLVRQ